MVKIARIHKFEKAEDLYVELFLTWLAKNQGIKQISYEAIQENESKTPDYHIPELELLLEVSAIIDREDLQRSKIWVKSTDNLQASLKLQRSYKDLTGTYSIKTSYYLRLPIDPKKLASIAQRLLFAIKKNENKVSINRETFLITKTSAEGSLISFYSNTVGSIDSASTIISNISKKLETANDQLGFDDGKLIVRKRGLLFINKYVFLDSETELIEGLCRDYNRLKALNNIENIWLQMNSGEEGIKHYHIFSASFVGQIESGNLANSDSELELLEKWFDPLSGVEEKVRYNRFSAFKNLIIKDPNLLQRLSPTFLVKVIRECDWLHKNGYKDDVFWIISELSVVNSPTLDPDNWTPRELELHQKILEHKTCPTIETVLGTLAWYLIGIIRQDKHLAFSLSFCEKLIKHPNLFIVAYGTRTLQFFLQQKRKLQGYPSSAPGTAYGRARSLVFDVMKMGDEKGVYQEIAEHLVMALFQLSDITTTEAIYMLSRIERSGLYTDYLIHLALYYNKRNDVVEKIDPTVFTKRLMEEIRGRDSSRQSFRERIAWDFWTTLREQSGSLEPIKEYLSELCEGSYEVKVGDDTQFAINEAFEFDPKWASEKLFKLTDSIETSIFNKSIVPNEGRIYYNFARENYKKLKAFDINLAKTFYAKVQTLRDLGVIVYDFEE